MRAHRGRSRLAAVGIALSTFAFAALPGWAAGSKDDPLARADRSIAEKRYNDAILVLTEFIKAEPERFDEAQRRLQRIVRLREEYNAVAGKLLDVLVNEPTNDEAKLAMIRRLEALETTPNKSAQEFLAKTKETALFTYNRALFDKIMAEGRSLIDQGQYVAAARKYTEGFGIYKEEFDSSDVGNLVLARVDSTLAAVRVDIERFAAMLARMDAATKKFELAMGSAEGSEGLEAARTAFFEAETAMLAFASVRNGVASSGRFFENQFLVVQAGKKDMGESSFLPFAYRFVLGRKTEIRPEGVLGSMDTLWINLANRMQAAASLAADKTFKEALAAAADAAAAESYEAAAAAFDVTASYAELAQRTTGIWAAVAGTETTPALTSYGKSIVSGKPADFLKYRTLARASRFLSSSARSAAVAVGLEASAREAPEAWRSGSLSVPAAIVRIEKDRRSFLDLAEAVAAELDRLDAYGEAVEALAKASLADEESLAYMEDARVSLSSVFQRSLAGDLDSAVVRYRIQLTDAEKARDASKAEYERGSGLLAGAAAAEGQPVLKYPNESIPVFSAVDVALNRQQTGIAGILADLGKESPRAAADPRIVELADSVRKLGRELAVLQATARTTLATARDRANQAESARLEAERRYEEARLALGRLNFDLARDRLQRAGDRYDASLAIQESPKLRNERDSKLLSLSAEISKIENEVVVRDVRRLLTQAKASYFGGAFDRAEDSLVQAQNRWRTTNVTEEPEVAYWLTLVRGALSIKTGRTIPPTAPLYPEMSQLLSFARKAFDEGQSLLALKRKSEALSRFEEAKKKLDEVRVVFPLNQEASLLSLRIDQLTDPDAFTEAFRRKVTEAQGKLRTSPQEAYSELQDLMEINPRYPGLAAAIQTAEVALGLRLPPPDPKALARAKELVKSAKAVVDANLRGQFPAALEQLNEALKLDPSDEQAIALKDRIQTDVGGQATVVLSSAAEREYQRAVMELQRGNTIVALSIVEQLLQDSRNRNSPRILELQRRIQSRL